MLVDVFTYNTDEPECIVRLWKGDSQGTATATSPSKSGPQRRTSLTPASGSSRRGSFTRKASTQIASANEAKKCVALFDVPAFKLRLQHLRELYDTSQQGKTVDFDLPENNPWLQP